MDALSQKLAKYSKLGMCSFHTPGHKGRGDLLSPLAFPEYDLTELPGLDMLHTPQGVIAHAQQLAADIYGAEETFFLVNGATVGNQAMLLSLAVSSCRGKKILIDRRAHRSVVAGLILSGLEPEYIAPEIHPDFKLPLGLDIAKFCQNRDDLIACHVTSPSYYGTLVDLASLIKWRDKDSPALPILVDQAHGAHFRGSFFPEGAVVQGADLVVHSTHKTLAALTQAAMIHVQGPRVNKVALKQSLELLQTSSPSYLLMVSLEKAMSSWRDFHWGDLYEEVMLLHKELNGTLRILTAEDVGQYSITGLDWTKILVNVSTLEIEVEDLVKLLRTSFQIEPELWDDNNIFFMLGIGSKPEDVRILREALKALAKEYSTPHIDCKNMDNQAPVQFLAETKQLPPVRFTPREAWLAAKRRVKVKDSLGLIAGETISVYPPGIPLIAAGEEITPYVLSFLKQADAYRWQGWQGFKQKEILIIDV
ncbi:MAG: amino acid decarboxylase [Peptococcaceae bacterium]|nr:amino acid decarboxylase [Peptococcaceae bacterium]